MTWHQTIIIGNLGADPELRYLRDGPAVCSFRVAVNERWNDRRSGERRERTTWYRVSAWARLGETCHRILAKGRQVMVIGTVSANAYLNREGEPAASLEMRALEVRILSSDRGEAEDREHAHRTGENSRESFAPPARGNDPSSPPRMDRSHSRSETSNEPEYEDLDDIPF